MATVTRETLVATLEEIALLLELKGANPFKTRAYRQGAEIVQNFDGDIVELAANDELKGIKGFGAALQQKLHELASTGQLEYYNDLKAEFPETLFELFELQGLGPKKKSKHSTTSSMSIPLTPLKRPANQAASPNSPALEPSRWKKSSPLLPIGKNSPTAFVLVTWLHSRKPY
jgi:hypothetical protein